MMTIADLKKFLVLLPLEFDKFSLANGEYGALAADEEFYYRLDKPIITLHVDEEHEEMIFLHQTETEIDKIEDDSKNFKETEEKNDSE